jgi:hypothetical protein
VKRESASRNWAWVFGFKPALGMGLASLLVVVFVMTGLRSMDPATEEQRTVASENSPSEEAELNSLDAVARTDVFEEILQLNADETASLKMILDEGVSQQ